jgi:phage-related minor tail protein
MTSTLSSFVFSLVAGASVLIAIIAAVIWVSSNDPLTRN